MKAHGRDGHPALIVSWYKGESDAVLLGAGVVGIIFFTSFSGSRDTEMTNFLSNDTYNDTYRAQIWLQLLMRCVLLHQFQTRSNKCVESLVWVKTQTPSAMTQVTTTNDCLWTDVR